MPLRLTARERQLVVLLLKGCTNRAIAETFGSREQTVKNQLSALYLKLGVRNRLQLVTGYSRRLKGALRDDKEGGA